MLPIFLMIVFAILETGHIAFTHITMHHVAYEAARIASLTAKFTSGNQPEWDGGPKGWADEIKNKLARSGVNWVTGEQFEVRPLAVRPTFQDEQAGVSNYDVVVTVRYDMPLIFPLSNFFLKGGSGGDCQLDTKENVRRICATVPMPIEQPLFK